MPAPPEVITVKRKRNADEAALDYLMLQPGKRYRGESFVYQPIRPSGSLQIPSNRSAENIWAAPTNSDQSPTTRRQFFLKRRRTEFEVNSHEGALFVEDDLKRQRTKALSGRETGTPPTCQTSEEAPERVENPHEAPRKFKKPSQRSAVSSRTSSPAPSRIPAPPDENMRMMQSWAMEETARALAPPKALKPVPTSRRFKPKPIRRYAERHQSHVHAPKPILSQVPQVSCTESAATDEKDAEGFVTETYIRIPAHLVRANSSSAVGMLVIEDDDDADFFFGEAAGSQDELEDDEDEDAENYYTKEYPDEDDEEDDDYGCPSSKSEAGSDDGSDRLGIENDDGYNSANLQNPRRPTWVADIGH